MQSRSFNGWVQTELIEIKKGPAFLTQGLYKFNTVDVYVGDLCRHPLKIPKPPGWRLRKSTSINFSLPGNLLDRHPRISSGLHCR